MNNILAKPQEEVAENTNSKDENKGTNQEAKPENQDLLDFTSGWNKALQDGVYETDIAGGNTSIQ